MQTIPIQSLELEAQIKGCRVIDLIDEMCLDYFKKKVKIKISKPVLN